MSSASFSIRRKLGDTNAAILDPKATGLIRLLLEDAFNQAIDAINGILAGFSIVMTARVSCDEIENTMDEIDALANEDTEDDDKGWQLFDNYIDGIRKLEELLLEPQGLFETTQVNLSIGTVKKCFKEVAKWEGHRENLGIHLQKLHALIHSAEGTQNVPLVSTLEQRRDDAALLQKLLDLLEKVENRTTGSIQESIRKLRTSLSKIDPDIQGSEGMAHCIKAAWVVHSAVLETEQSAADQQRVVYLGESHVWEEVERFAEVVATGDENKLGPSYLDLCYILNGNKPPPDIHYVDMFRDKKSLMRPFAHQNRILLRYCRELVNLYNPTADKGSEATNEVHVMSALQEALNAVKIAALAPSDTWLDRGRIEQETRVVYTGAFSQGYNIQGQAPRLDPEMGTSAVENRDLAEES